MKEYMKMSDFIVGNVSMSMNHNGDVSVQYDCADPDMVVRKTMDAMAHAINSHDELIAEVGQLRARVADLEEFTYHFCDNSYNVDLGGADCTATTCEAKDMAHKLDNRAWPDLWPGH